MDDELILIGDFVKATQLADNKVKVEGYLVTFSGKDQKDLDGDYFPADCFYGKSYGDGADTLFHHGIPVRKGLENLAKHIFPAVKTVKDDIGIFAETILDQSDAYEKAVAELVQAGKIKWSSGSTGRLVRKEKDGKITRWPIIEASLTHTPANPFTTGVTTIKAFTDLKFDEEKPQPETIKGIFESALAERQFATYELWSTFEKAARSIALAAKVSNVSGMPVDIPAKVDEAVAEFSARLAPVVAQQIQDFQGTNREEFWLKSFDNSLLEGDAHAAMPMSERIEAAFSAVQRAITDAKEIQELRVKSGRAISATRKQRLTDLISQMRLLADETEMMLSEAEPKAMEEKSVNQDAINNLLMEIEFTKLAGLRARAAA